MEIKKHLYSTRLKAGETYDHKFRKLYGFIFDQKTILSGYRGSLAHNLYVKKNTDELAKCDTDTFSLYCFPKEYYFSLEGYYHSKEVSQEQVDDLDDVSYEIRKAIHLLAGCNPNVMTFLYNKDYFDISEGGKLLLKNKALFLGKKRIKDAYGGYAYAQLTKLQKGAYKGYMGKKRKELVDKIGYDTKNAMTLIRLLLNGIELLKTGSMTVYETKNREWLMDIKKGKYPLSKIKEWTEEYFSKLDSAYEKSSLPLHNNRQRISELLVDIIEIETKGCEL